VGDTTLYIFDINSIIDVYDDIVDVVFVMVVTNAFVLFNSNHTDNNKYSIQDGHDG